jgi:hypothetical protein
MSTPHTQDVINKLWYGPSHKAATALYQVPGCLFLGLASFDSQTLTWCQVVLFNNEVCQGFDYMSQEQFFTPTPPPNQIEAWCKAKGKKELQEHGYAHEDAFIAKSLAKLGCVGYLLYQFAMKPYSKSRCLSIVKGKSTPLTTGFTSPSCVWLLRQSKVTPNTYVSLLVMPR